MIYKTKQNFKYTEIKVSAYSGNSPVEADKLWNSVNLTALKKHSTMTKRSRKLMKLIKKNSH